MAYTITSESYGRRLPKITATADSTDDLAALGTNYAEGSTVNVGGTTYSLDKVSGWIVPGSGGGGGIYDEYDLIVRMDYYFDPAKMKFVLLSITPSLDDAWEILKNNDGVLTLVVTQWGSAEKDRIEGRTICDGARLNVLDEFAPGGATYYIEGSKTTSIFPDGSTGSFAYTSFEYDSSTGELNISRPTSYIVSITKD